MNLTTTLLFYLLFGGAVAVAVHLTAGDLPRGQRWFRTSSAIVFWPFYLPTFLQHQVTLGADVHHGDGEQSPSATKTGGEDKFSASIEQVETELDLALTSLGGWSDAVLARERCRFDELRVAWRAQAEKVRDLDRVLGQLDPTPVVATVPADEPGERTAGSHAARRANITRLQALRDRHQADLLSTLAWVRELVTLIHLAKFTGAPASRAEELVAQIATSIEGLSEVASWRDSAGGSTDARKQLATEITEATEKDVLGEQSTFRLHSVRAAL